MGHSDAFLSWCEIREGINQVLAAGSSQSEWDKRALANVSRWTGPPHKLNPPFSHGTWLARHQYESGVRFLAKFEADCTVDGGITWRIWMVWVPQPTEEELATDGMLQGSVEPLLRYFFAVAVPNKWPQRGPRDEVNQPDCPLGLPEAIRKLVRPTWESEATQTVRWPDRIDYLDLLASEWSFLMAIRAVKDGALADDDEDLADSFCDYVQRTGGRGFKSHNLSKEQMRAAAGTLFGRFFQAPYGKGVFSNQRNPAFRKYVRQAFVGCLKDEYVRNRGQALNADPADRDILPASRAAAAQQLRCHRSVIYRFLKKHDLGSWDLATWRFTFDHFLNKKAWATVQVKLESQGKPYEAARKFVQRLKAQGISPSAAMESVLKAK